MAGSLARPRLFALLIAAAVTGCSAEPSPLYELTPVPDVSAPVPDRFEASSTGSVSGRVVWSGPVPEAKPFRGTPDPAAPLLSRFIANPLLPQVDAPTRGVAGVVVFLDGVDPRRARPWDYRPVRVELDDTRIRVRQFEGVDTVGFVRIGGLIEVVSVQPRFQAISARGTEFFGLPFPDSNRPHSRTIRHSGLIELSSAAHFYWERAYLFAAEHPYYTCTDREGRFTLRQVPPGDYDLVYWTPNWKERSRERDPETCQVARLRYAEPFRQSFRVTVGPRQSTEHDLNLSADRFPER